jgi:CO/xanthine dehydrogenase FAD-binding subunit
MPAGEERRLPVADFVLGPQHTALRPGELLRAVDLPAAALRRRAAFRQISLTPLGRSAALLIGTRAPDAGFALTVTAATRRPVRLEFADLPTQAALRQALGAAIPDALYYDDCHGAPDWRRHMTHRLAQQIRHELSETAPA